LEYSRLQHSDLQVQEALQKKICSTYISYSYVTNLLHVVKDHYFMDINDHMTNGPIQT
jgi:hypothetical protein